MIGGSDVELTNPAPRSTPAPPRPARCLTKVAGQSCPNPPVWDLLLHCSGGHPMGGGPACADHKHEVEGGVPHGTDGGWITLAHAVPL